MTNAISLPEYWMRGPVAGIPGLLQPVAHALLQAREEVNKVMTDFPPELLWKKPAGMASPGFHLQHLRGVLDRLATYARGEMLSPTQLEALGFEGKEEHSLHPKILLENFNRQIDLMLAQLANTDAATLEDFRGVGRQQLPSTVIGLLFHAAEHTMRHNGQLLVTVAVLKDALL
ncbi:DinB superfamily protein [Chitinophaga costaii]|uniref:DinB superfamily protein n=1 Tax=Chitinophaga costaii TaxID=1335309 RepID=A0A1C4EIP4_9BACT|nr:DinB family protein [Chitinophaga costaii]PUZ23801.1 DinB family protein [Chitinophaga costaii]SCC43390.1 DinB superfamily protein [Chitinophaga costaii]